MRKLLVLTIVLGLASWASADVLWDQQPTGGNNYVDQEFGDFGDYSSYMVTDVDVDTGGWNITSVTTYFTTGNGTWAQGMGGRLNIFDRTGALPAAGDDPTAGLAVAVDVTVSGGMTVVTASGLDIDVPAGAAWIGLAPSGDFAVYGQEFHLDAPLEGDASAWRNPGNAFGNGTEWLNLPLVGYLYGDPSITIEGTIIPEPASLLLLGLGALLIRRR